MDPLLPLLKMPLLKMLDTRAFTSLWFWLLLVVAWWRMSRQVLGVPWPVVARARRELKQPGAGAQAALDELEAALLVGLGRLLRPGPRLRLLAVGGGAAALALLLVLGFHYRSELAQALFFLLAPQASALMLSVVAAHELVALGASAGEAGAGDAEVALHEQPEAGHEAQRPEHRPGRAAQVRAAPRAEGVAAAGAALPPALPVLALGPGELCARLGGLRRAIRAIGGAWLVVALAWGLARVVQDRLPGLWP